MPLLRLVLYVRIGILGKEIPYPVEPPLETSLAVTDLVVIGRTLNGHLMTTTKLLEISQANYKKYGSSYELFHVISRRKLAVKKLNMIIQQTIFPSLVYIQNPSFFLRLAFQHKTFQSLLHYRQNT